LDVFLWPSRVENFPPRLSDSNVSVLSRGGIDSKDSPSSISSQNPESEFACSCSTSSPNQPASPNPPSLQSQSSLKWLSDAGVSPTGIGCLVPSCHSNFFLLYFSSRFFQHSADLLGLKEPKPAKACFSVIFLMPPRPLLNTSATYCLFMGGFLGDTYCIPIAGLRANVMRTFWCSLRRVRMGTREWGPAEWGPAEWGPSN